MNSLPHFLGRMSVPARILVGIFLLPATYGATALATGAPALPDVPYEWPPESVFRESTYHGAHGLTHDDGGWPVQFEELDPGFRAAKLADRLAQARTPRVLSLDPAGATRAEIAIEHTNPHIGTVGLFSVNPRLSKTWLDLPRPAGMPARPEAYHHTVHGTRVYPLPLAWLRPGDNEFVFAAGPQIHEQFGFGCLWIYDFTVRVFHPRDERHPRVRIANWRDGDALPENPAIILAVTPGATPVARVDVFASHEGYDESGGGFSGGWHGRLRYGRPEFHVGTAVAPDFTVTWDTTWVPDQAKPIRLIARAVDEAGWHVTSAVVDRLQLTRTNRRVLLIGAEDIPPRFSVMHGQEKECHLSVPALPGPSVRARLLLATSFGGPSLDSVRWNGTEIARHVGRANRRSLDAIDLPPGLIRPGQNTFSIYSTETVHGPEVDWPGPALLLEFAGK